MILKSRAEKGDSRRALPALLGALLLCGGCGYHLAARVQLPGGVQRVTVLQPALSRTGEPALGPRLTRALQGQLARRGIHPPRRGEDRGALLGCRIHALEPGDPGPLLDPASATLLAEALSLVLECRLSRGGEGATLWRSGRLVVEASVPRPHGATLTDQEARDGALDRLARRAAAEVVAAMESAKSP